MQASSFPRVQLFKGTHSLAPLASARRLAPLHGAISVGLAMSCELKRSSRASDLRCVMAGTIRSGSEEYWKSGVRVQCTHA
jgi:hypothetical protein